MYVMILNLFCIWTMKRLTYICNVRIVYMFTVLYQDTISTLYINSTKKETSLEISQDITI